MAWRARVDTKDPLTNGEVRLGITYFDDAAPTVPLWHHFFTFARGTTRVQAIAEIREVGQRVRDSNLFANISVGDETAV